MAKLYYRYGAMNCGKTTSLLQVAHNYEEKGMNVVLIKPLIDTKGKNKVVSRIGLKRVVDILLSKEDAITDKINTSDTHAIIVDEAQFLTSEQVDELYNITKEYDIPVLCYGLRTDFQMVGFSGSTRLLQIADDIEELKTICRCGSKATHNLRLIDGKPVFDGEQVVIDNSEEVEYEAVCGNCYLELKRGISTRKKYLVMIQDEWNNLYYMGEYDKLNDSLADINDFISVYDVQIDELEEYAGSFSYVFDKEIVTPDETIIMVRGFILEK